MFVNVSVAICFTTYDVFIPVNNIEEQVKTLAFVTFNQLLKCTCYDMRSYVWFVTMCVCRVCMKKTNYKLVLCCYKQVVGYSNAHVINVSVS